MKARGATAKTIVALANNLDGVFQRSVLQGANEVFGANGVTAEVVEVGAFTEPGALEAALAGVAERASGVLVITNAVSDEHLLRVTEGGAVATLVSHHAPSPEGPPTTMFDNRQGVQQLVRHLVEGCGRARPVFIGGDKSQLDAKEREKAFLDEAARHDLRVPRGYVLPGDFTPERASEALAAFIAGGEPFDSVVAADYLMAIAAQDALRAAGLSVPGDVAVVGFGDGPEAEAAGVTTVAADVVELGNRAARQLVAQMEGRRLRGRTLLSTHLLRRESSC